MRPSQKVLMSSAGEPGLFVKARVRKCEAHATPVDAWKHSYRPWLLHLDLGVVFKGSQGAKDAENLKDHDRSGPDGIAFDRALYTLRT